MAGATDRHEVRRARLDDVDAMVDLLDAVAAEGRWLATESPFDVAEARQRTRDELRADEPHRVRFVAVEGTDPAVLIGSIGLTLAPYGVVELGMLVADGWRGRGVGSALLVAGIAWAVEVGAHKVALQVWPHNEAALALYRKHGFEEEGRLRSHYRRRNGELWDAVVMGLLL